MSAKSCDADYVARHLCVDCGVNVIEAGEYYLVWRWLWDATGLTYDDNLCIGCLEARLGRRLTARDFPLCPLYPWLKPYPRSARHSHRLVAGLI